MPARPPSSAESQVLFLGDCRVDGPFCHALCQVPEMFPTIECFVMNLECAVADSSVPRIAKSHPLVATYAEFERVLAAFHGRRCVFNLSNNHSADAGDAAGQEFIRWCGARGVAVVDGPLTARVDLSCGTRLGLAAGCDFSPNRALGPIGAWNWATSSRPRQQADLAVFLAHWGEEYVFYPSPRQVETARALWSAGFQLVVGCHPHVVQGTHSQAANRAFYSLGNATLYLDCMLAGSRIGAALRCACGPAGEFRTELLPYTVAESGAMQLLDAAGTERFRELIQELSVAPADAWWWRQQAARVFFRNHLVSWRKRIQEHGLLELARMLKAFTTGPYWRLGAAWLAGIGRATPNDQTAERLERLAAKPATPRSPGSCCACCLALLETGIFG